MSSAATETAITTINDKEQEGVNMAQEPAKPKCGCGQEKWSDKFVYVIGQLGVDFVNQARQDSLQFHADGDKDGRPLPITLPVNFARYLLGWKETYMVGDKETTYEHRSNMYDAKSVYWTLWQNETPLYIIQPMGPFAEDGYKELVEFYAGQAGIPLDVNHIKPQPASEDDGPIERVAISGVIVGEAKLSTGEMLPVIVPHMRGTSAWSTASLAKSLHGSTFKELDVAVIQEILLRLYEETRNFGIAPEERAINYVATNVFSILVAARSLPCSSDNSIKWEFDMISANKSKICRTDSECYDIEISFYNPDNLNQARKVTVVTVDVSDVVPVIIGDTRNFSRR